MFSKQKKLVMCQSCRALVDTSASVCPMCGRESVPSLRARASTAVEGSFFISFLILTINILLFVLMAVVEINNGKGGEAFFQPASGPVLYDFGGLYPPAVAAGQWWRLVTFNFLHIGLMHLAFNSSALYQIGPQVEELYGSQKFVFIYMATGIFSAFASFVFNIGGAGASGAIFGLIGLMAVYGYRQGGSFGQAIMKQMLTWAVIGFLFGVFIGANNVAHASGFAAGAAVGFALKPGAPETNRGVSAWNALAIICVLVLASSFAMAGRNYGNLQRGGNAVVLDRRIEEAREALKDSVFAPESKKDTKQISERLKSVATDLDRVPQIDDRSTEIKQQVAELLRKRAGVLDSAEQNKMVSLRPTSSDLEEAGQAFDNYEDWINSVMDKYGLVSVPKK